MFDFDFERLSKGFEEQFELLEWLGSGWTTGAVSYLAAERDVPHRRVVLRILPQNTSKEERDRFLFKAKCGIRLTHPHILSIYELGEMDDAFYYSMAAVDGEDLHTLMQRRIRFLVPNALRIVSDLASALVTAHRSGVTHGNLGPCHVLIERKSGAAKLKGFGISPEDPISDSRHQVYQSPELRGRAATPGDDLFALGALFYELLAGVSSITASLDPRSRTPIRALRDDVPDAIALTIDRLLYGRELERLGSAQELLDGLRDLSRALPEHSPRAPAVLRCVHRPESVALSGLDAREERLLLPGTRVVLGRSRHCDIRISENTVAGLDPRTGLGASAFASGSMPAKRSAVLHLGEDGTAVLSHAGTAHNLKLNGAALRDLQHQVLRHGDLIELSTPENVDLKFQFLEADDFSSESETARSRGDQLR